MPVLGARRVADEVGELRPAIQAGYRGGVQCKICSKVYHKVHKSIVINEPTAVHYGGVTAVRWQAREDHTMEGTGATHELLSVDEVASYLGVGPITVYRWCGQGRLPASGT